MLINEAASILLSSATNICCSVRRCSTLTHHTNVQTTVCVIVEDNKVCFLGVMNCGSHLHVCGEDVLSGPADCFPAAGREQHPSPWRSSHSGCKTNGTEEFKCVETQTLYIRQLSTTVPACSVDSEAEKWDRRQIKYSVLQDSWVQQTQPRDEHKSCLSAADLLQQLSGKAQLPRERQTSGLLCSSYESSECLSVFFLLHGLHLDLTCQVPAGLF